MDGVVLQAQRSQNPVITQSNAGMKQFEYSLALSSITGGHNSVVVECFTTRVSCAVEIVLDHNVFLASETLVPSSRKNFPMACYRQNLNSLTHVAIPSPAKEMYVLLVNCNTHVALQKLPIGHSRCRRKATNGGVSYFRSLYQLRKGFP